MTHIQQRLDTEFNWSAVNPVLFEGEAGHESDTGAWKVGDGVTAWNDLPYKDGVDSVAGRTGDVVLTVADVGGAAPLASPAFSGNPTAPTPNPADDDTSVATTGFVKDQDYATNGRVDDVEDAFADALAAAIPAIKLAMNPIGTIYESTVSTNPSTFIGGTWAAYGSGRVLVAIDPTATDGVFDNIGEEGGDKTVTLTAAQSGLREHGHGVSDPGHFHRQIIDASYNSGAGGSAGQYAQNNTGASAGYSGFNTENGVTGISVQPSGSAPAMQAHTNLQPYVVVYRFRRTA